SETCQQMDLGAWAQEAYAITGDDQENDVSTGVLNPSQEDL
ncbi:MAG: DNA gyrase inhibitor YacG, partial [Gammaproteobacteria bacterium]|nr:DNA gyrase inhibitor YacG [Gammaproteobacteria bacterium]